MTFDFKVILERSMISSLGERKKNY
jgi:hypothetical protein